MVFPLSPIYIFFQLFIDITKVLRNSYFILLVIIPYYHYFVAQIVTDLAIGNPCKLASVSFWLVPIFTSGSVGGHLVLFLLQPGISWPPRSPASFPSWHSFTHWNIISPLPSALTLLLLRSLLKWWVFVVLILLCIRRLLGPMSDPLRRTAEKTCVFPCSGCRWGSQVCMGSEWRLAGVNWPCLASSCMLATVYRGVSLLMLLLDLNLCPRVHSLHVWGT